MGKYTKAKQFYNRIKDKSKYKLVNGLFIVRYVGDGNYKYVGDFHKKGSIYATPKYAMVETYGPNKQLFNPSKKKMTTQLGYWTKLSIGFKMKPISAILD